MRMNLCVLRAHFFVFFAFKSLSTSHLLTTHCTSYIRYPFFKLLLFIFLWRSFLRDR
jgi:hypothetical protein